MSNDPAFVYVLAEHKSTPDHDLPLQLAGYMIQIWKRHLSQKGQGSRNLPPIIPIVCYHGQKTWTVPSGLHEMIVGGEHPELRYLPGERYILRNLLELPFEKLSQDVGLRAGFIAMRREALDRLTSLYEGLKGNEDLQNQVLTYILQTYPDVTIDDLQRKLRQSHYKELEDVVGTIAETLIAEGKMVGIAEGEARGKIVGIAEGEARGEAQGRARTLVRLMERRFGVLMPDVHNRIQSASVEQLDTWLDRILDAQSIGAVFEDIH